MRSAAEAILGKLRTMNFADIQEQGFIPLYTRDKLLMRCTTFVALKRIINLSQKDK